MNEPTPVWLNILFLLFLAVLPWSVAAMQVAAVLFAVGAILHGLNKRRWPVRFHPFYYFMIMYFATQVMAALFSPTPVLSFRAVLNNDWFLLIVPFILSLPLEERWKRRAVHTLLVSATLVALYGIFQTFFGYEIFRGIRIPAYGHFYRAIGGYNFYLTFAGNQLLAFGMALALLLSDQKPDSTWRWYLFATILILFSILGSFARSAWLGVMGMVILGVWLLKRRYFWQTIGALVVAVALLVIIAPDFRSRLLSIFNPGANQVRLNLWRTGWSMWKTHVLWGIGPGRFNELFPLFKVPGVYDATGHTHNDYLNMAVNSGLAGFLAWLSMWIAWFYFTGKAAFSKALSAVDRQIVYGSLLALTGMFIAAFFQCYFTDLENNIFWWTIATLGLLAARGETYRSKSPHSEQ